MNSEILILAGTAATLGFVHTLIGPDHYFPFILSFVRFGRFERYAHAMAGAMIFVSGLGVRILGL
jgi:nickel/cobalt exporter